MTLRRVATGTEERLKDAAVLPAGTTIEAVTVTAGFEVERLTVTSWVVAVAKVNLPVMAAAVPPVNVDELTLKAGAGSRTRARLW